VSKKTKIVLAAEAGEEEKNENQEQPAGEVVTEPQEPAAEPTAPGEEVTGEESPANPPEDPQDPAPEEPVTEPKAEEPAPEAPAADPEKKDNGRFNETFVSTGSGYTINVIRRKRRELGK
jgi:hypothetical protein